MIERKHDSGDTGLEVLAKGAGTTFIGKAIGSGLGFATQLLLARLLGSRLFGLYALGYALYDFAELFASLGLTSGAVRFASIHFGSGDHPRLKGVLQAAVSVPFVAGSILALLLFVFADRIAVDWFAKPDLALVLKLFAIGLPFGVTLRVAAMATTGFHTTRYFVVSQELILRIADISLIALLVGLGAGLPGSVIARGLASLIAVVAALHFLRLLYSRLAGGRVKALREVRKLLTFSMPLVFAEFAWLVLLWTDILMVGAFRPSPELGAYRAASNAATILLLVLGSIGTIFAPLIADLHARGDSNRLRTTFRTATRWSFAITLPCFLALVVLNEQFLLLFGRDFTIATAALSILAIGQMINAASGGVDFMLVMSGHQYLKLLGDSALAVLNVGLNLLLIPRFGIAGAAIATAVSIASLNLLRLLQVRWVLGMQPYSVAYVKPVAAGVVGLVAGLLSLHALSGQHFLSQLVLTSVAIGGAYGLTLWKLGIEEADRAIMDGIIASLAVRTRKGSASKDAADPEG